MIAEIAGSLEDYGSSRANFQQAMPDERVAVAKQLLIAKSQHENSGEPDEPYKAHMAQKCARYFHECGKAGIDINEAKYIWWNFVYDDPDPNERDSLIG